MEYPRNLPSPYDCNDCSLNRLIFGAERIEIGANKYQKGIRNSSAISVNQADSRKAEEFRITESDARWGGRGAGWGGAGHGTAVHGRAGLGRVGYMFS